jgi:hypothetical protein
VAEGRYNDQHVEISLEYLPDFSEEYSIKVRSGFGTAGVQIRLDQGWNLTQINQELDSNTDEIIGALSGALGSAAKLAQAGGEGQPRFVINASNVPLGYYEGVIASDPQGRKQLYGWRYVGFLPYRQCPGDGSGLDCFSCQDVPSPLFGLVYQNGTLTFKRLDEIERAPTQVLGLALPDEPPVGKDNMIRLPDVSPMGDADWGTTRSPSDAPSGPERLPHGTSPGPRRTRSGYRVSPRKE